jgi:hypothetical protein
MTDEKTWTPSAEQVEALARLAYEVEEGDDMPDTGAIGVWWRDRVRIWLTGEVPRSQLGKAARVAVLAVAEQMQTIDRMHTEAHEGHAGFSCRSIGDMVDRNLGYAESAIAARDALAAEVAEDRAAVRTLLAGLPKCWRCAKPATLYFSPHDDETCDDCDTGYRGTSAQRDSPLAPALRALLARVAAWPPPAEPTT